MREAGLPLSVCPFCGRELKYCPQTGKLHTLQASLSTAPGAEGEVLRSSLRSWPGLGGGPEHTWSVDSPRPIAVPSAIRTIGDPGKPPSGMPIAAAIAVGGRLVFVQGANLRGFWPGLEELQASLSDAMSQESWRLMAWHGKAACVLDEGVDFVDLAGWVRESTVPGRFIAQIATRTHWVGATKQEILFVEADGTIRARHPFDSGSGFPHFCATSDAVYGARGGKIYRFDLAGVTQLAERSGRDILHLGFVDGLLLALAVGERAELCVLSTAGEIVGQLDLECATVYWHPVVMANRAYVIDDGGKKLIECGLDPLRMVGRKDIPAVTRVDALVGCRYEETHLLALFGYEGANIGRVVVLDAETGRQHQLTQVSGQAKVMLHSLGDRVVVTKTASYENTISVFDLTTK